MKYKYKHPEVNIRRVTGSTEAAINGTIPKVGQFVKTDPLTGQQEIISSEELRTKFTPIELVEQLSKSDEIKKLAQTIIDSEAMVDDDNSEELLHEAVENAQRIKRLV
jgi:hypothetical protein